MNERHFNYAAEDVPIAWFIKNSIEHRKRLQVSMQSIAHVAIQKNSANKPEFVFSQLEGGNIYPAEFKRMCLDHLKAFLRQYTTKREYFEQEVLDRQPQTFFRVQSKDEDRNLYVRWYKDAKHVLVCGEIRQVEQKLNEIRQQLPTMANRSISNTLHPGTVKIEVPDRHVAMFIKNSDHMGLMKHHFKNIAEVQVKTTGKDTMEYQFTPSHTGHGFKQNVFEDKCSFHLNKFLFNYDTQILKFNETTLRESQKHSPEYFKSQTPEENKKLFVSWHPNNVLISGPKIMVHEKVDEINKLFKFKGKEKKEAFVKPINNKHVGMFIKKSQKNKEELDKLFSDFAVVSISENSDRKMEFRCLQKGNGMPRQNFEEMCINLLSTIENRYKTEQLEFNKGKVSNSTLPLSYFNPSVGDQQKVFVRWYKDTEQVLVCGLINDVDQKLLQITKQFGKGTKKPWNENKLDKQNKNLISETEQEQSCPKYKCRILIVCDILKKVNATFKGRVQVRCFPNEEKIVYVGLLEDIEIVKKEIISQENALLNQIPTIAVASSQFLQMMFENNKLDMEENIYDSFNKKKIKCVTHMEGGILTLVASNKTHIKTACDALSAMVKTHTVDIPEDLSSSALKLEWSTFVKRHITLKSLWAVQEDQCIRICGLEAPPLMLAEDELNKLFERILKKSIVFRCSKAQALIIETHRSDNQGSFPISTTFKAISEGVEITGPKTDVLKVKERLSNQIWHSDELQFIAPNLVNYFGSDQWKKTCKLLISEYRCAVLSENTGIAKKKNKKNKKSSSPVKRNTLTIAGGPICKYGDIAVEVCLGDITKQVTDAIVNGCTKDFNLSHGELSPHILHCAGSLIQTELLNAVGDSCRITNGYKLPCRKVVHMATPKSEDKLSQRILDSLLLSDKNSCKSVAMPTLGAGGIGLDVLDVSRAISTAFLNFASGSPKNVKTIKLIVFDESVLSVFRNYILSQDISFYSGCTSKETILSDLENKMNALNTTSKIEIISDVAMNLIEAAQYLRATLESSFPLHTVSEDSIEKLEVNDKIDIFQNAVNLNSVVTIESRTISIRGCLEAKDFVFKVISDLKESLQLLKTCKWQIEGYNELLPPRVGLAIERRYKTNQKATFQVDLFGEPSPVDLSKMTILVGTSSNSLNLQRSTNEAIELPPRWDLQLGHRVVLSPSSEEYAAVLSKFQRGGLNTTVHQIERIQNEDPYRQFKIKENNVRRNMISDQPVLRQLFHGTSREDADKIINKGFNRSFAGKNATAYGLGVYFATTSSYSTRFANRDVTGRRRMFLAEVVTGDFVRGDSSMKEPPMKNSRISYDSVVDNIAHPSMFVVFNDTSVYPSYLITFH